MLGWTLYRDNQKFVIGMRWALAAVSPALYQLSGLWPTGMDFYAIAGFVAVNMALTIAFFWNWNMRKIHWIIVHLMDLFFITAMVLSRGGVESENFNVYYLFILQAGMLAGFRAAIFCLFLASSSYVMAIVLTNPVGYDWNLLIIRLIYLLMVGVASSYLAFSEKKQQHFANTDFLTRTYNRKFFHSSLTELFSQAKESGSQLSMIMVDLDNFKDINDSYGHQAGDTVLEEVGAIIKASIRDIDLAARYGGEEFVVILPQVSLDQAVVMAERIRQGVQQKTFSLRSNIDEIHSVQVTVSCGVTSFPGAVDNINELLARADNCLYTAKKNGRNRVVADME